MPVINGRVLSEENDLSGCGAPGGLRAVPGGRRLFLLQLLDEFVRFPALDVTALHHALHHPVEQLRRRTRAGSNAAGMKAHVAFLYAFRHERPKCRKVLRESDGGHEFGQFGRRLDTRDLQTDQAGWIRFERAADNADSDRQDELSFQVAGGTYAPFRECAIRAIAHRKRVRCGLDRSPVVSGRNRDGIYAVHDALVMRSRTIRISICKLVRGYDAVPDGLAGVAFALEHI